MARSCCAPAALLLLSLAALTSGSGGEGGGTLHSWGVGGPERLGRPGDSALPLPVGHGLEGVRFARVAAGGHTCGVSSAGAVWCWGRNSSDGGGGHGSRPVPDAGQLGHGEQGRRPGRVRGELLGLRALSVAAGRYHSAAAAGGRAFTWGLNDQGQLGRGATTAPEPGPQPCTSGAACRSGAAQAVGGALAGLHVVGVAAGRYSTLAFTDQGQLYAWGLDGCATGAPAPPDQAHRPRRVRLVEGDAASPRVVALAVGYVHWLALTADGAVYSCNNGDDGYAATLPGRRAPNADGELGRGGTAGLARALLLPGRVEGALLHVRVVAVAAGRSHSLAASDDGRLFAWGNNQAGQLGAAGGVPSEPQLVTSPHLQGQNVTLLAAGEYFSMAALRAGGLLTWGSDGNGQLGRGEGSADAERDILPARGGVAPPARIISLAAGYQHGAAVVAHPDAESGVVEATTGAPPSPLSSPSPVTLVPLTGPLDIPAPRAQPSVLWASRVSSPRLLTDITAASPDVFRVLPSRAAMLPGLASPCWRDALGATRCMPLVQVVGVSKCGTTDLFKRLARHPDFVESANKGPHFWDESPVPESPAGGGGGGGGGFSEYLALFDALAARVAAAPQSLSADASSNTFTASGVWRRGHSPVGNVSIGELLFEAAPYSRLVLLLRDPSERLFSAFHYYRRLYGGGGPPATAAQFDAHVDESLAAWAACLTRHQGDAQPCIRAFEPQQLIKGMYSQFLWDWTPRFPAHQLLVMRLEDYSADTERHLRAVFQFAGMRAPSDDEWQTILGAARANARDGAQRRAVREQAEMLPQTRQKLRAFYAPFNAQLAQMLRDERFAWADA